MITNTSSVVVPSGLQFTIPSHPRDQEATVNNFNNRGKHCPECDGDAFEYDHSRDETFCLLCGLVLSGPPAYVAGRIKIVYPWVYHFEADTYDQHNRYGFYYFKEFYDSARGFNKAR